MKENTKKEIKFFISYARANDKLATSFRTKFETLTKLSKRYQYSLWSDKSILPGEKWEEEIQKALEECELGLLLTSSEFLASDYIKENELSKFVGKDAKPVIPVMLLKVDIENLDLKGLEGNQFFMLSRPKFDEPKAYSQCNANQRLEFVGALFKKVESRLAKLFSGDTG